MTDINYKGLKEGLKTPLELLSKEKKLLKELKKNNIKNYNTKKIVNEIYLLYKKFQNNNKKNYKFRIEFLNEKDFIDFINFFQFTKRKQLKNIKGIHTTMSETNSQSLLFPSLSLFIETFIDYRNNINYSKKYIIFKK